MFERIAQILMKEFIQAFRDKRMRAVIFGVPVIQLLVLSQALNTNVRNIKMAIVDSDSSVVSRELTGRFTGSGFFKAVNYTTDMQSAASLIDMGGAQALLVISPGFEHDVRSGKSAPLQLILDGTDSNTGAIILNYSSRIVNQFNREYMAAAVLKRTGAALPATPVEIRARAWFNENLESRNFYIPALLSMLVTVIALLLTSMAIVREKEIGTMEQIMVTPISPAEFIIGKTLPFALVSMFNTVVALAITVLILKVPFRGSYLFLLASTLVYLLPALGIGLYISTVSNTQQQAMMSCFLFLFPALLLSGFMFPIANMPEVIQYITYLNPLRYFLVVIRGVFFKGAGIALLWPQLLAMFAMGVVIMGLAARRFRKTAS